MCEIRTLSPQALSAEERERIACFLPPFFEESPLGKILILAAYEQEQPLGALLAYYYPIIHTSHIDHLYVLPNFRQKGVATSLITACQNQLREEGIRTIEARFNDEDPTAKAFFRLSSHFHWSKPKPILKRYFFDPLLFTPSWLTQPPRLPLGSELFPWNQLLSEEREQLNRWLKTNPMIEYLSPDDDQFPYEPLTSIGLRNETGLLGWTITHRIAPRTLRYSALYIHPEYRGGGGAVTLLAQSIRLHSAKLPHCLGLAEIQLDNSSPFWKKFVNQRLNPLAISTNQRYSSYKIDF